MKSTLKATSISTIITPSKIPAGAGGSIKNCSWRQTRYLPVCFVLPMDECLARCALDISGRRTWNIKPSLPTSVWAISAPSDRALLPFALIHHGRDATPETKGKNDHHRVESLFKAFGRTCARPSAWKATPCPRRKECCKNVVILDTGCANLNSVKSAIGVTVMNPKSAVTRTSCCWPITVFTRRWHRTSGDGSGARARLFDLIKACTQPVLGICLGMHCWGGAAKRATASTCWASSKRRAENDRLWSATATYGLEPRYPQAGNRLFQGIEDGAYFYLFTATQCQSIRGPSPSVITATVHRGGTKR